MGRLLQVSALALVEQMMDILKGIAQPIFARLPR